jgi:hypothetical protein
VADIPDIDTKDHNKEVAKLCFEFFKHFTTIATAAALVELAVYERLSLASTLPAIIGVFASGLTLVLSIIGMLLLPIQAGTRGEFPPFSGVVENLLLGTGLIFFGGIGLFAYAAITNNSSTLVWVISGIIYIVLGTMLYRHFMRLMGM